VGAAPVARRGPRRPAFRLAPPGEGRCAVARSPGPLCGPGAPGGLPLLRRGARSGLLGGPETDRPDVLAGARPDDLFRLHVLPVERPREVPDPSEGGAHQPRRLCERGPAERSRAAVPAPAGHGGFLPPPPPRPSLLPP